MPPSVINAAWYVSGGGLLVWSDIDGAEPGWTLMGLVLLTIVFDPFG
jgi:hypothetical protein